MQRAALVKETLIPAGIKDARVLSAIRDTPRHLFVPRHLREHAYFDMALPIGDQQTISSPFIVAYMTESLAPEPTDRVLEIGTGSGYQAAILSPLVKDVYTIEIVRPLGLAAQRVLKQLRLENVHTKIGDGFQGWPDAAPFDKIIVTCSPEDVPQPLIDQLREGGRMVIPVGERYQQTLYLYQKVEGKLQQQSLRPTLFVPMTGRAEDDRDVKPDPTNPQLKNGSFEEAADESGFVPGWYYQRQAVQESPEGSDQHFITFRNQTPGRDAHLLQGLAVDGRTVRRLRLAGRVKANNIRVRNRNQEGPRIVISFYDESRRDLGFRWLGPWLFDTDWRSVEDEIAIPGNTREILVRIGLFGATGEASFDDIELSPVLP